MGPGTGRVTGRWRSSRGPSCCGTAGGTCWAGRAAGRRTPPPDLDALGALEDHLSQGWPYPVEAIVDAKVADVERWLPRSLGRLEPAEEGRTRLRASTEDPDWYVRRLAVLPTSFRILGSEPVTCAMAELSRRLAQSAD